ncbi:unnamed protein product, partial [Cyprideis torosa]
MGYRVEQWDIVWSNGISCGAMRYRVVQWDVVWCNGISCGAMAYRVEHRRGLDRKKQLRITRSGAPGAIYQECGVGQGCFGCSSNTSCYYNTDGCLGSEDCEMVVNFNFTRNEANGGTLYWFKVTAVGIFKEQYSAFGFGSGTSMSPARVVHSIVKADGEVNLGISSNDGFTNTILNLTEESPISFLSSSLEAGISTFEFTHNFTTGDGTLDLENSGYRVLMAHGHSNDGELYIYII